MTLLTEKWQAVLKSDKAPAIKDTYREKVTAQLLENQEKFLAEAGTPVMTPNVATWEPVVISLVRRLAPVLIAYDICGVQPMTTPAGLAFALRAKYNDAAGQEALFNVIDKKHSGTAAGTGIPLPDSETQPLKSMSMVIEKVPVTALTRQLRADYSIELAQDMKALHGLDAEQELSRILAQEITAEINREVVDVIYNAAKQGAQFASTPGEFDLTTDADGRWSVERFKGLMFAIERDANAIAFETRRGKGNLILCSADIASALVLAGVLDYAPALESNINMEVDTTGVAFAGNMGRFKVFVDPLLNSDQYVVGYKGANQYDAGLFYCPYVPLQILHATDTETFQPALGFKTRYGLVANPLTTLNAGENVYYRKATVKNLL